MLERLFTAISVYYNYTGEVQCFNTSVYMTSAASDVAWDYQVRKREREEEEEEEEEEEDGRGQKRVEKSRRW